MSDDQYSSDPETPPKRQTPTATGNSTPEPVSTSIAAKTESNRPDNESDRGSLGQDASVDGDVGPPTVPPLPTKLPNNNEDDFTEEQNELVAQLLMVCSEESAEACKKALKRHNFNVDMAALELLTPAGEPAVVESTAMANQSQTAPDLDVHFPRLDQSQSRGTDMEETQASTSTSASANTNANSHTQSNFSSSNYQPPSLPNLRQRRNNQSPRPTTSVSASASANLNDNNSRNIQNLSYAAAARARSSETDMVPWLLSKLITIFKLPVSLIFSILTAIFPARVVRSISSLTRAASSSSYSQGTPGSASSSHSQSSSLLNLGSRSNFSPREEVKNSIELLINKHPEYSSFPFFKGDYNEVLSKCKTEVKYLIVYIHVDENDQTDQFLNNLHPFLDNFFKEAAPESLFWTCRLDSREGAKVSSELFISVYPCLALLAPVSSARVSCINQIYEAEEFDKILKSKDDFFGEMVVLLEEKRKRESDIRLRREQEQEYQLASMRDTEKLQKKQEEVKKIELKKQEIQNKKDLVSEAKSEAKKLVEEEVDSCLDGSESSAVDFCKIMVRLPDGSRIEKKFKSDLKIKHVRALIMMNELVTSVEFVIQSQFPSKTYANDDETISSAFNNSKSQLLFIKAAKDESIEENSSSETESSSEEEESSSSE